MFGCFDLCTLRLVALRKIEEAVVPFGTGYTRTRTLRWAGGGVCDVSFFGRHGVACCDVTVSVSEF